MIWAEACAMARSAECIFTSFRTYKLHLASAGGTKYVMFSGGVAEFIYSETEIATLAEANQFGDIGPLLGQSIRKIFGH